MSNRYNAGNWREYYFDVKDSTVNSVAMNISWKDPDTNLSVFVADPKEELYKQMFHLEYLDSFRGGLQETGLDQVLYLVKMEVFIQSKTKMRLQQCCMIR